VGWELQRSLAPLGELLLAGRRTKPNALNLLEPDSISALIRAERPDVIVNAAAYTAVDRAESEPDIAHAINGTAVGAMAREAAMAGSLLVHFSTDYVFSGAGCEPWIETSPTAPVNLYGESKLEGESAVRSAGCQHLIFRTSWVYAARGANFLRTMLRLASEREHLSVVNDQFGAPTGAELIADVTAHAIWKARRDPSLQGLYHLAASGETTWFDYARHLIARARDCGAPILVKPEAIQPVPATAFPTPAKRPSNSRLATGRLRQSFALTLPDWRAGVDRALAELIQSPFSG
jgi:dTDP-4-dehydrorhamnose reductase